MKISNFDLIKQARFTVFLKKSIILPHTNPKDVRNIRLRKVAFTS
jgi:hypothetical protein